DLSLTKDDSPDPVVAGGQLTYTLTAHNEGPSPATNVVVGDPLPAGVTFVSANASQGTCDGTSTVSCSLGTLASGASATVTIVVRTPAAGTLTNTATVSSDVTDPAGTNNSATATTTVSTGADVSIMKVDAPDPVAAGQLLTYTLTARNDGPASATGV